MSADGTAGPAGQPDAPLLEVSGLSIEFRTSAGLARVVQNVSFQVGRGEALGLVGESGSGKTTTSLGIMGLLPANGRVAAGSAKFRGRDLLQLPGEELRTLRGRQLAMIFQDALRCLNPAFTIGDQIAEPARQHLGLSRSAARARAKEMLDLVEIPRAAERIDAYPHMLSGGMCQRVMLAMALVCEPALLFADEPTTALDVTVQSNVLALLDRLRADLGLSVVFITHDLGVVSELCDRVAVMYAGEIVEIGNTHQVFRTPQHPYTAGLLGSIPGMAGAGTGRFGFIRGTVPAPTAWPHGCRFNPRCDYCEPDRCTVEPIPLRPTDPGGQARCVRSAELELAGVSAAPGSAAAV
ncbi:MAG: ABC transporter ATP-binding protein [Actinomycetota bacterium]|nr:MAG: ABC transporter ATP-binding protein [Actinomycetota bacterium]